MGFRELLGKLIHVLSEDDAPQSTGTEATVLGTLADLALHSSSPGCSSLAHITSLNKVVN